MEALEMGKSERAPLAAADADFWRGRRVMVTGHTGFKGAWLSLWLSMAGAKVAGFSLPKPAYESLMWSCALENQGAVELDLRGDIRNPADIRSAMKQAQPEAVFHLAAQPIVLDSYINPDETWDINVMGTMRALEAARAIGGVQAIVAVTSDKCYENKEWAWGYRENDEMGGLDPYSSSKGACEILISSWRRSFGKKHGICLGSARAGNVIGGGDSAPFRVMPDMMKAFAAGAPGVIRRPQSTRPYQHALDPLSGYLLMGRRLLEGAPWAEEGFNFGPEGLSEKTAIELGETAALLWGDGAKVKVEEDPNAASEAEFLGLDSTKARKILGWRPSWGFKEALGAAIAWEKARLRAEDMSAFSKGQIEAFCAQASGPRG